MTGKFHKQARTATTFKAAVTPVFVFAPIVAVLCWTAAWIFRDQFILSATLIGLGCLPIVIAVVAYLLVLLKRLKQDR